MWKLFVLQRKFVQHIASAGRNSIPLFVFFQNSLFELQIPVE